MTHNARAISVERVVCDTCEQIIDKCSDCGEYFTDYQKIRCVSDGLNHKCEGCAE